MTMRLSTAQMQYDALSMIRARQGEISKYQQQIASGVKLTRGADDPTGIADVQHLDHALASLAQFDRNSTLLGDRLRQQEGALADAGDLLQRARELAVQAGNGALSDSDRHAIVVELRGLRESMLQIANRDDGRGRQLFAGTQDGVKPFTSGAGAVSYLGNDGQNLVDVAPDTALADTDAGSRVFMNIPTGDGISRARVHIALPERSMFRAGQSRPTAAVTISLEAGAEEGTILGIR
ncbi:MAG: flagellar hook-associated protein FlgL, partial [Thermomonas haemolytica]